MADFIDDIKLSDKATSDITRYRSFGDAWVKRALRAAKARVYIERDLDLKQNGGHSVGRCCSAGTLTYARKDGKDITDDDITALLCIERGQENYVQKREAKQVTIYWLCDSSD